MYYILYYVLNVGDVGVTYIDYALSIYTIDINKRSMSSSQSKHFTHCQFNSKCSANMKIRVKIDRTEKCK